MLVADDELVLGAAAGVDAGLGAQRAPLHDVAFMIGERMLVKRGLGQVPVDRGKAGKSKFVGAMGAVAQPCLLHGTPPVIIERHPSHHTPARLPVAKPVSARLHGACECIND